MRPTAWLRLLLSCLAPLLLPGAVWSQASGLPQDIAGEVSSVAKLPGGQYTLVQAWEAEGKAGGHQIGRAVGDPDASEGKAWEARISTDAPTGALLFGPYAGPPAGDYVAFFRLKLLDEAGEDTVGELDAAASYGLEVLRTEPLVGSGLKLGRYVYVPLAFHYERGPLECRVNWSGYAGLRVDRVALFRLEGGTPVPPQARAAEAKPSGLPRNLSLPAEKRPFPSIFPRSAVPSKKLVVFDLKRVPPDWQLAILALQGLVNRRQPTLYCLFNATDDFWLDWMRKRGWTKSTETIATPEALLGRYAGAAKGVIITDPALPASRNVATMLAGVRNALPVSPRMAEQVGLPVLEDLRGRWRTSADAYRWAFDKLWPKLNHHVIACSYPDHLGLRDYLVQNRVFIFWLSGAIDGAKPFANPTREARLMEQLLAKMPANIPVMSYPWAAKDVGIGEGPGVTLFAEFGKYLVGSINCSNLSVHSGIRVASFRQRFPAAPKLRKDKVYVSWVISDGDNLPVLTVNNYPQLWKDPVRGKLPIGWSVSPSASLLIPDILSYYYSTATPADEFLTAVSGVGYTYPDSYGLRFKPADRKRAFDGFLAQTTETMRRMDLRSAWIMNATRPQVIARYAAGIPGIKALFPDYGKRVISYSEATYPTAGGVPVFHAVLSWPETIPREERIQGLVREIRSMGDGGSPRFLHLFVLNWFADLPLLQEVQRRLGPRYVAVRPTQLADLYRQQVEQDKVLVRAPSLVSALEGRPVAFEASFRNTTSRPVDLSVAVAGLGKPLVSPGALRLAPWEERPVQVTGVPGAGSVTLKARGSFGSREASIAIGRVPAREVLGKLPAGSLVSLRRWEAEDLAHRSGSRKAEASASGGAVWSAGPGTLNQGWVMYGPYTPLPAGRYLALVRLRRTTPGSGLVVTLDVATKGGTTQTAKRDLSARDLPEGEFRSIPLVFNHTGAELETRAFSTGAAGLEIDRVDLWRVR
ncbi:MAG TPA: GxGYxYP domain-containing protein [Armatimonadota bacterium]